MAAAGLEKLNVPPEGRHAATAAKTEHSEGVASRDDSDVVRFIPVSRSDVMDRLARLEYWLAYDRKAIGDALHYLGRLRQQDSAIKLDELMDGYHPFNPDNDMEFAATLSEEEKIAR